MVFSSGHRSHALVADATTAEPARARPALVAAAIVLFADRAGSRSGEWSGPHAEAAARAPVGGGRRSRVFSVTHPSRVVPGPPRWFLRAGQLTPHPGFAEAAASAVALRHKGRVKQPVLAEAAGVVAVILKPEGVVALRHRERVRQPKIVNAMPAQSRGAFLFENASPNLLGNSNPPRAHFSLGWHACARRLSTELT